ncbi:MAG: OmpA family protein [Nitrospiraceae bacterium]|nr:OmpA family protein [Nitrospirota bacterium]MDA8337955.1 OmpA family protein [Nitrospiraceae bacterium]
MRRRRKKEEEHENVERWLISYADFITLMFTFFAALYALSTMDMAKIERFSGSLKQAFKVIDEPIPLYEDRNKAVIEDLRKVITDVSGVSVKSDPRGVVVTFSDAVLFASGSADIKQEAFGMLEKLSKSLSNAPGRITIEGHTDNIPTSGGKYASNWELSTSRAASVLHFFITKGVDPNRFSIAGYGEYRPLTGNDTEDGRAKNRRVELVIAN